MESYKAWRRIHLLRVARIYVKNYPWSPLAVSVVLGLYVAAQFRNVIPGVFGAACTFAFSAWYWRPGGRGRREFGL